jgi:hypothetical protein
VGLVWAVALALIAWLVSMERGAGKAERYDALVADYLAQPEETRTVDPALAERLHAKAPLDPQLFAMRLENAPDAGNAEKLAEQGMALSARHLGVLRQRLAWAARDGDVDAAVETLDLLLRLGPPEEATYLDSLLFLYVSPRGRELILEAMEACPAWGRRFVNRQVTTLNARSPADLSGPIETYARACDDRDFLRSAYGGYLRRLGNLGHIGRAHDVLLSKSDALGVQATDTIVQNTGFEVGVGLPPFDWMPLAGTGVISELQQPAGGFYGSVRGTGPAELLSQIVKLPADRVLTLSYEGRHNHAESDGYFEWQLACSATRELLTRVRLGDAVRQTGRARLRFRSGGADCPFGRLTLMARPANDFTRLSIEAERLVIEDTGPAAPREEAAP